MEITKDYAKRPAVLSVKDFNKKILLATDHFFLTMFSENEQERTSTHYTGGDPSMYVGAGRSPRLFSYGGILVDSLQFGKQMAQWLFAYEHYLRGTKCVRRKATVELVFRDQYRKGYMASCKIQHDSKNPLQSILTFTMFIIDKGTTYRLSERPQEEQATDVDVGLPSPV